jgi:hypothetical protein
LVSDKSVCACVQFFHKKLDKKIIETIELRFFEELYFVTIEHIDTSAVLIQEKATVHSVLAL